MLHGEEARTHRLLQAIVHQSSFFADDDRLPPWQPRMSSRYALPEPRTWHQPWDGLPHLVAGSAAVLKDCQVEILGPRRFPGATTTRPRLLAAIHGGTAALDGWDQLTPVHQGQITQVLVASRGSFVFDEDLLHVAHLLGLSFADAEQLRKALKKREEQAIPHLNKLCGAA